MFSGIVEKTGELAKIEKKKQGAYFTIKANNFLSGIKIGDSIACDGVCLTVIKKTKQAFTVELMPETLKLTKFAKSKIGERINLEKSLKVNQTISGHFVAGHVDAVGKIKKISKQGKYISLILEVPNKIVKYLAYKGSVSINGVSLTIAARGKKWFKVCLISHTLAITNLGNLRQGSEVNLEVDLIARYLESLLKK